MTRKVLIYGDVNLNYRDGSGAWLEAYVQCLHAASADVHVLLKADVQDISRLSSLESLPSLTIHHPYDDRQSGFAGMKPREAASRIVVLDRRHRYDLVVSRGFDIASHLAISRKFTNRLWPYITEGPIFSFEQTAHQRGLIATISHESRRIFFQTEDSRSIAESLNGTITGKTLIMNPIVPDSAYRNKAPSPFSGNRLNLAYAGKFARHWNTLEMTELPQQLEKIGIDCRLEMVGDKFQNTGADHAWLAKMKAAASTNDDSRVHWHGGKTRAEVFDIVHNADVGLCWRSKELDASPEISTKMLECAALGTPPVLNRTSMHEQLLGADYPLFVDTSDVVRTLRQLAANPELLEFARERAQDAVKPYSMSSTAARIDDYFTGAGLHTAKSTDLLVGARKQRIVIAGHDFKFAGDLIDMLNQRDDVELRIDKWHRLNSHDKQASSDLARWADTVICEWAAPNSVFYADNIKRSTRLLVRFHGFEVRGDWISKLNPEQVDAFIFVSDFYRRDVVRTLGWPESRTTVIPNTVDSVDLSRQKLEGAQFHIGMAGFVPFLKRPDRAVDLLDELLRQDNRFYLHIRGRVPWHYPWEWQKAAGQDAYREFFGRISNNPRLRSHIIFEPFSPDMGNWFRGIGWMVSPSTQETFHLAPVEGMASGSPALVWSRDGATEIFGPELVRDNVKDLAQLVLASVSDGSWIELSQRAKAIARRYDRMETRDRWFDLINMPKGARPRLHGESILRQGQQPSNRAEALVALDRAFESGGVEAALEIYDRYSDWLEDELAQVTGWRRLSGWADGSLVPRPQLSPLYRAIERVQLVVGKSRKLKLPGYDCVPQETPRSLGSFDKDVLLAADTFARAAIRERASGIVASGPLATVVAAELAARRLGIEIYALGIDRVPARGRVGEYFDSLYERVSSEVGAALSENGALKLSSGPSNPNRLSELSLDDLTIGLIADEFTSTTIGSTLPSKFISRKGGVQQLSDVDALIIESAWEGKDKEWFHGVAYHGEDEAADLWELIAGCRQRGIPVLLWNKEDPVHFHSFAQVASRVDHVFTTDANKIESYLNLSNSNLSVGSQSFFAEPSIHNPLPTDREYSNTIAFAGSYYGSRYPQRSEELKMILEEAAKLGLTIYDRQHDRPESPYQLPEELKKYSVGSVPYDSILDSYKSHPVNINVNSVSDSPSMFSRRVIEIAASGSVVASGIGRGVSETLGSAFPVLTRREQWHQTLHELFTDEDYRLRIAWAQLRSVMRTRRADQALALMLRTAGIAVGTRRSASYGWEVSTREQVDAASKQSLKPTVITADPQLKIAADQLGLPVSSSRQDLDWVTCAPASVASTHFEDLLIATWFVQADVLSATTTVEREAPLVSRGIGDIDTSLWRPEVGSPANGTSPWKWRFPKGNE